MSDLREYIVILKNSEDLEQFYDDMETPGGDLFIPNRAVDLAYRRSMSRATHYYLTDEEAATIRNDPRVADVTLPYHELNLKLVPLSEQSSSNWDKSGTNNADDVNWGLLRGYEAVPRAGWGSDGTAAVTATIALSNIGRDVDVVIMDGHIQPNHPEFAVNADGTGGSRVVQFNWFQYNQQVRNVSSGTYVYDFVSGADSDLNHGHNVASIAVGNTCGWARGANIYNIHPYAGNTENATGYGNYLYDLINYIRVWHQNKAVNPKTGVKNPTIVNMSIGFQGGLDLSNINQITYQGTTYNQPGGGWTVNDRIYFDLVAASGTTIYWHSRDSSMDADVEDAIADGIIMVGAAGNFYMYNDVPSGVNYNNKLTYLYFGVVPFDYYYMRGPSPGSATGCISVSAIDSTVSERKSNYSNAGPRTDIFAAGTNIMGAQYSGGVADPRNGSYAKAKMSGTSMASPQVTGLLACALEVYPRLTPAQAKSYIREYANTNLTGGGTFDTTYPSVAYIDYNTLYGADNKYAVYKRERKDSGEIYPKKEYFIRQTTTGRTWPRVRIRRT